MTLRVVAFALHLYSVIVETLVVPEIPSIEIAIQGSVDVATPVLFCPRLHQKNLNDFDVECSSLTHH
jgi:hypothetical protein